MKVKVKSCVVKQKLNFKDDKNCLEAHLFKKNKLFRKNLILK